jgi:hypothetical protein
MRRSTSRSPIPEYVIRSPGFNCCFTARYRQRVLHYDGVWYQLKPKFFDKPGPSVLTALIQSSLPSVPAAFQEAIGSGQVRESIQAGTYSLWTNDSRTTLRVAMRPAWPTSLWRGVPLTGFSHPTCSRTGRCWPPHALFVRRGCQ